MTTRSRMMPDVEYGPETPARPVAPAQGGGFSVIGASDPAAATQPRAGDGGWECRVTMDSDPDAIPLLVAWLLDISAWRMGESLRVRVRGALSELLLNAVEHGNLELGFQEKQAALIAGTYDRLIARRLTEPRLKDRRVIIHVSCNRDGRQVTYRIADEGRGFPWRLVLQWLPELGRLEESTGRGIFLVRSLFPSLTYNERGTEATITVPFA